MGLQNVEFSFKSLVPSNSSTFDLEQGSDGQWIKFLISEMEFQPLLISQRTSECIQVLLKLFLYFRFCGSRCSVSLSPAFKVSGRVLKGEWILCFLLHHLFCYIIAFVEKGGVCVCVCVCVGGEGSRKFLDEGGDYGRR